MPTAEDYKKNARWVRRMEALFDLKDVNKTGKIDRKDFLAAAEKVARETGDNSVVSKTSMYLDDLKFPRDTKIDKNEYIQLQAAFSATEFDKILKSGAEATSTAKGSAAWFEALDKDNSGSVNRDQFFVATNATGIVEDSTTVFKTLMAERKITKRDFVTAEVRFWLILEDTSVDGLYGAKFEL